MLRDSQLWTKIGRICTKLAKRLDISPERAFDIFQKAESVDLVCVSDSIPTVKNIKSKKLKIISLANMISKAIDVD